MDPLSNNVPIRSEIAPIPIERPTATGGSSFAGALNQAISAVDSQQLAADAQVEAVARGTGNLHEAALALEKASISMRVLVNVRNKVVSAYQDIMKMTL